MPGNCRCLTPTSHSVHCKRFLLHLLIGRLQHKCHSLIRIHPRSGPHPGHLQSSGQCPLQQGGHRHSLLRSYVSGSGLRPHRLDRVTTLSLGVLMPMLSIVCSARPGPVDSLEKISWTRRSVIRSEPWLYIAPCPQVEESRHAPRCLLQNAVYALLAPKRMPSRLECHRRGGVGQHQILPAQGAPPSATLASRRSGIGRSFRSPRSNA